MAISAPAWAGFISANTPLCISEKALKTYVNNAKSGQAGFNQDLLDRASCYVELDGLEVALLKKNKEYVEVKLKSGHSAWAKKEAYSEEKPVMAATLDAKVVQPAVFGKSAEAGVDETVAEKSSWFEKIRSYWPFN